MTNKCRQATVFGATTAADLENIRKLFQEYADSLPFKLDFQDFEQELATLPGKYAPPEGHLLLAYVGESVAGGVGLRKLEDGVCEMKRLYVRPEFQGYGAGRALVEQIIQIARAKQYRKMRLDTVPPLQTAIALYRKFGFVDIPPYCQNPVKDAIFLELDLSAK